MGNLSQNIGRSECACGCGCGFDTADIETVRVVQECADHIADSLDVPKVVVHFNSWCRCLAWNDHEDGSEDSAHLEGRAADFWMEWDDKTLGADVRRKIDPDLVYFYLSRKYPDKYGVGRYKDFTHLDTRSGPARRWVG